MKGRTAFSALSLFSVTICFYLTKTTSAIKPPNIIIMLMDDVSNVFFSCL
ncbi:unnamed protein product [Knipowitschia caucasica]